MNHNKNKIKEIFSEYNLEKLFPKYKTEQFFEALFGDPKEGAYDIELVFKDIYDSRLEFEFLLKARPGKCLACSRTYGLPRVFSKHPIINIEEIIKKINNMIKDYGRCERWKLGPTRTISPEIHSIPLLIFLTRNDK